MREKKSLYFLIVFFQAFEVKTLYVTIEEQSTEEQRRAYIFLSLRKETDGIKEHLFKLGCLEANPTFF